MSRSTLQSIAQWKWRYYSLPNVVATTLVVVFLVGISFSVRTAMRAAGESACHGHLYHLAHAVRMYELENKKLPATSNGSPPHSWRILILPELGCDRLFAEYKFDEPWDSAANLKVLAQMPPSFTCRNAESTDCTSYFLHVDDAGKFAVFERNGLDIPWTKPEDVDPDAPTGPPSDPGGFGIATPTESGNPLVTFRREAK